MKRLLAVSDIHPGSVYGMLPPDFQTSTGNRVKHNAGQAYLWACWLDSIAWATQKPLDAIVVLGDVVEGKQPKSRCSELCLPLVIDQEEAARKILGPLLARAPKARVYFVKGTFYHDDEQGRSVDNLAQALRGEVYEGLGQGIYAKEVLDLEVDGTTFDFSHGISVSGGLYRAVAAFAAVYRLAPRSVGMPCARTPAHWPTSNLRHLRRTAHRIHARPVRTPCLHA